MSAAIETAAPPPASPRSPKLRAITVAEYDSMIENGIFDENNNLELLNGAIVEKMTKGTKHSAANDRIARLFYRYLPADVVVRNQNPIWLDDFSEPEPDIVLAAPRDDEYETTHPTPAEIFLIVEISDSTLDYDRHQKGAAYARAGIRQYLLLNVQERTIEDYREPGADGYGAKQTLRAGQTFNLEAFPEIVLKAEDFLPIKKD